MPEFNPVNAWNARVNAKQHLTPAQTPGQGNYSGLLGRVRNKLENRSSAKQFEVDTAMWHGAIHHPGSHWKGEFLKRLFCVLAYGGLVVKRDVDTWVAWADWKGGAPICSSISHGARVLITLPETDTNEAFWTWLWGNTVPEARGAATHGVEPIPGGEVDLLPPKRVMKGLRETKGDKNVDHFGVNVCLGGNGYMNPISGKIISENGKHGHVYIAYYKGVKHRFRSDEVAPRRAILVNCEQSSPIDRQVATKGKSGSVKSFFGGISVPDQYGGGHGLGGHSRFASTGGDDFSYGGEPTQLGEYGCARGFYYDGMYIDLSNHRFNRVQNEYANWDDDIIGQKGIEPLSPPPPPIPNRQNRRAGFWG